MTVRYFNCIFCRKKTIDDKGNVDITQNGEVVCCWPCWKDRPTQPSIWYLRFLVIWQKKHIPYRLHYFLWTKIYKHLDEGIFKYA